MSGFAAQAVHTRLAKVPSRCGGPPPGARSPSRRGDSRGGIAGAGAGSGAGHLKAVDVMRTPLKQVPTPLTSLAGSRQRRTSLDSSVRVPRQGSSAVATAASRARGSSALAAAPNRVRASSPSHLPLGTGGTAGGASRKPGPRDEAGGSKPRCSTVEPTRTGTIAAPMQQRQQRPRRATTTAVPSEPAPGPSAPFEAEAGPLTAAERAAVRAGLVEARRVLRFGERPPPPLGLPAGSTLLRRRRCSAVERLPPREGDGAAGAGEGLRCLLSGELCRGLCEKVLAALGGGSASAALSSCCMRVREAVVDGLEPLGTELHARKARRRQAPPPPRQECAERRAETEDVAGLKSRPSSTADHKPQTECSAGAAPRVEAPQPKALPSTALAHSIRKLPITGAVAEAAAIATVQDYTSLVKAQVGLAVLRMALAPLR